MRRASQQEWENEHMHNPMTEGEALAVDVGRKTLTDAALIAAWEAKAAVYEQGDDLGEQMMALQLRDCANELRSRAAIAAHTAASGLEVVAWALFDPMGGKPEILTCKERPYSLDNWQPLYRHPPAAVPADALERLVESWNRMALTANLTEGERAMLRNRQYELAALIPKGADHEQR